MGSGIAQVVAGSGLDATIVDISPDALDRALRRIERSLERLVRAGALDDETARDTRARIRTSLSLEQVARDADHVIESVTEDMATKIDVFSRLDAVCRPEVVFATNTSQFSISGLAAQTSRPDRVIGSHWFNPPPVMQLIELVRGSETSDATLDTALALAERYGKQTVICKKDTPGFITSRLIAVLILESARIVEEGIADAEDVNKACVLAFNHALGPLDTADLSGLDTLELAANAIAEQYGERFRPPQIVRGLVEAGHFGRKTGRGFRTYTNET
jgi:3-hydroxybutyryl-CoA dehydrogenase